MTANLPAVAADRGTGTIIEARDLVLSFGETPALRGASLTVRRGEMMAVMGPSGSGKSTLLHCPAGILVPDEGEVRFADEPTGSLDSVSGELVTDLLTDVARERGTTVVLVTHDARVAAYAGREGVVRDGAISTLTGARP